MCFKGHKRVVWTLSQWEGGSPELSKGLRTWPLITANCAAVSKERWLQRAHTCLAQAQDVTPALGLQPSKHYSCLYHLKTELLLSSSSLTMPVKHFETVSNAVVQEIFNTETTLIFIKFKLKHSRQNFYILFLTLGNSSCWRSLVICTVLSFKKQKEALRFKTDKHTFLRNVGQHFCYWSSKSRNTQTLSLTDFMDLKKKNSENGDFI